MQDVFGIVETIAAEVQIPASSAAQMLSSHLAQLLSAVFVIARKIIVQYSPAYKVTARKICTLESTFSRMLGITSAAAL